MSHEIHKTNQNPKHNGPKIKFQIKLEHKKHINDISCIWNSNYISLSEMNKQYMCWSSGKTHSINKEEFLQLDLKTFFNLKFLNKSLLIAFFLVHQS